MQKPKASSKADPYLDVLLQQGNAVLHVNFEEALANATKVLESVGLSDDQIEWRAGALRLKALSLLRQSKYLEALPVFYEGLVAAQRLGSWEIESSLLSGLSGSLILLGDQEEAQKVAVELLIGAQQRSDSRGERAAQMNSAMLYLQTGEELRALEIYGRLRPLGDVDGMGDAVLFNNRGVAKRGLRRFDEALADFKHALSLTHRYGGKYFEPRVLANIGETLLLSGDVEASILNIEHSLACAKELNSSLDEIQCRRKLGDALHERGDAEAALEQFEIARRLAIQTTSTTELQDVLDAMRHVLRANGEWQRCLTISTELLEVERSFFRSQSASRAKAMMIRMDFLRFQRESDLAAIKNEELSKLNDRLKKSNESLQVAIRAMGVDLFPKASRKQLTLREMTVLKVMCKGFSNAEIGKELSISALTVRHHASIIYSKLGVRTRTQAVAVALRDSLLDGQ